MSDEAKEPSPSLDLSDLKLVPKWVSDFAKAPASPRLDDDSAEPRSFKDRRPGRNFNDDRRGGGPPRDRPPFRGPRPPGQGQGQGQGQSQGRDFRGGDGGGGGNFRGGPRGGQDSRGGGPRRDQQGGGRGDQRFQRDNYEPQAPQFLPELTVQIQPEAKATEAMAAMIRNAGKAYSVFDAARLILASGDRFHASYSFPKASEKKLYGIPADGSLWLSREEAVNHFLHSEGIKEFYQTEDVELEEPKGNFASVAVCGMTGEPLGPPSHHSYQAALHRIHRERFAHMSFEDYKRRVRTDSSPEAVQKWKDSQKKATHWVYLTPAVEEGAEPLRLKSRAEMEAHFRTHHAQTLVHETSERVIAGNIPKNHLPPVLFNHLRKAVDEARRHLLQLAQQLCHGFEQNGLKLFKRRGGKLWVSRTRPRALDSSVVLADRISKIVEHVKANPGITWKALIETVAPHAEAPAAVVAESTAPEGAPAPETTTDTAPAQAQQAEGTPAADTSPHPDQHPHGMTPDQLQALKDLHWLNSEGYVIEYSDGPIFPGVTDPPPPKPKPVREPAPATHAAEAESDADAPSSEATAPPESAEAEIPSPDAGPVSAELTASEEIAATEVRNEGIITASENEADEGKVDEEPEADLQPVVLPDPALEESLAVSAEPVVETVVEEPAPEEGSAPEPESKPESGSVSETDSDKSTPA